MITLTKHQLEIYKALLDKHNEIVFKPKWDIESRNDVCKEIDKLYPVRDEKIPAPPEVQRHMWEKYLERINK